MRNLLYCMSFFTVVFLSCNLFGQTKEDRLREALRIIIENRNRAEYITAGGEKLHSSVLLPRFYIHRTFKPAWIDKSGITRNARVLYNTISLAYKEGLEPNDYHFPIIGTIINEIDSETKSAGIEVIAKSAQLELLLTDAFLIYCSHLLSGKVNPIIVDPEWRADRESLDLLNVLQNALNNNTIEESINGLLPRNNSYHLLKKTLNRFQTYIQEVPFNPIPEGPVIRSGGRDPRLKEIRRRLEIFLGSASPNKDPEYYDNNLRSLVSQFQFQFGIDVDGSIGPQTLAALNTPVENLVQKIKVNLERWRWLPQDLGNKYLIVNIPDFWLKVIENEKVVHSMPAIIGTLYRRTPVFNSKIRYLVFNPYWFIPKNIAVEDYLPHIRKNSDYLKDNHIRVFNTWGADAKELDSKTIDWSSVNSDNFNFALRKDPGGNNPLGNIKFMFPNQFNVYLHDTPDKGLFKNADRLYSSGCIRIQYPLLLANYLLSPDTSWTMERIVSEIKTGIERTVTLAEPVDIYILYWTVWIDENGNINFRKDIYERDKKVLIALNTRDVQ